MTVDSENRMLPEKAIDILSDIWSMFDGKYDWSSEKQDALDVAKEALIKQIPMKTLGEHLSIDGSKVHLCGNCGDEITGRIWDYCPLCGQRIDWGER